MLVAWREGGAACRAFIDELRAVPHDAYLWETPPIRASTVDRPFEYQCIDAPTLARVRPMDTAFAEHWQGTAVVTFANLGRDATLVVPEPLGPAKHYTHLAAFVRHAPEDQVLALWRAVGEAAQARLSERPVWISTSGLGIYWLHVRLDDRPKYYAHAPYRSS